MMVGAAADPLLGRAPVSADLARQGHDRDAHHDRALRPLREPLELAAWRSSGSLSGPRPPTTVLSGFHYVYLVPKTQARGVDAPEAPFPPGLPPLRGDAPAGGRILADPPREWEEVDVDSDPELARRYGDSIPVLFVNGRLFAKVRLPRLAAALRLRRAAAEGPRRQRLLASGRRRRLPPRPIAVPRRRAFAIFHPARAGIAQLVERQLPKLDVAGSNPVARSTRRSARSLGFCPSGSSAPGLRSRGELLLASRETPRAATGASAEFRSPLELCGGRIDSMDAFCRDAPRSLRDPRAARRGRDGGGVPGAGPAAGARRRDQGPARRPSRATPTGCGASSRRRRRRAFSTTPTSRPSTTSATHDGAPYVVQELLEGETLRAELAGGRFSPRKAIDYAIQIAQGLAAAHEKGIVHRDLKPENLFVTRDGRVKILDFGLAKLTQVEGSASATNLPTRDRARRRHGNARLHVARAGQGASPPTRGATSSRSARSSTRCSRASARSAATRPARRWRRS